MKYGQKSLASKGIGKVFLASSFEDWIRAMVRVRGDGPARAVSQCRTQEDYIAVRCKDCGNRKVIKKGCKRDECPDCGPKNVARRAINVYSKLSRVDDYHYHIVFTVPDALQGVLMSYRDWTNRLGRVAVNALRTTLGGKIGGFYSPHNFSSSEPWLKQGHLHLMMPRKVIRDGRIETVTWIDHERLKEAYRLYFYEEFGYDLPDKPVINIEIVSNQKARTHTIRYVVRNPMDFKNMQLSFITQDQMEGILDNFHDGHKVNWFGYLANSNWRKFFRVNCLDQDLKLVSKYGNCEKCGGEYELESYAINGLTKLLVSDWVEVKDGGSCPQ